MDYCNALKKKLHFIELPGYVISLDNIDLNLLPLKYGEKNKRDEPVPLWSVAGPSQEYFEFEVLSEEINDDGEGERLENATTLHCHICDVAVPVNYFEDHKKSFKHQVCTTITDISLERARRQMALSIDSGASHRSQTTYYCSPCSIAVSIANEGTHVNTEQHRLAVAHEKFSNYLMLIYKDKSNFQKVYGDIEKEFEKPAYSNWCEEDPKIFVKNETEESVNVNLTESWERVNPQKYIDDLNYSLTDCSIEYLDDYTITLKTKSGSKLKVSFDNFHGIHECNEVVKCRVCRKLVDDKYEHIFDENHMLKICRTIYNKHCIRQLDLVLNHCIVCNEIIHSAEAHILYSGSHKSSLKDAIIDDHAEVRGILAKNYIDQATNNESSYFCNLCQMYFDKSQLDEHVNSNKHSTHNNPESEEYFKYCSVCDLKLGHGKKALTRHERKEEHRYKVWLTERDVTKHHHMEKCLRNTVVCKICVVRINNSSDSINDHVNSSEHESKYQMLLAANYMERIHNISVRCNVCNKNILFLDELTHMNIKRHKNKLIKNENKMMLNSPYMTKTIQTSKVTKDNNNIEKSAGKLYCDVCSIAVEATLFDIHFASSVHKTNLAKQMNPETTRPSPSVYAHPKKLPKKLHYLFDLNDDVETVKCKVCNVNLTFENILTHRKDRTHKDKYAAVLQSNSMFRIKNRCFCEFCMEIMKIVEEHNHIMSNKHLQNTISMTHRMDTAKLKEIAYEMFNKDKENEKRAKLHSLWPAFMNKTSIETQKFSDIEDEVEDKVDDSQYQEYIFMTNSSITYLPENERDVKNDKQESLESNSEDSYVSFKSNSTAEDNQSFQTAADFTFDIETQKVTEENDFQLMPYDHLFEKTENDKQVNCKICFCAVSSRNILKREHLEGAKHISKYEVLLLSNEIKEKIHESKVTLEVYYCNACGIDIVKTDLLSHVDSASHKLYLTAQPSTSNFKHVPSKTTKPNALELALNDSKQSNAIKSQIAHLLQCIDKNIMYCELCDSEIFDTLQQLVNHICCPYHKAKVQSLLNEHEVREIDDAYFCELCGEFTKGNEIEHIYSEKHKKQFHDNSLPPKAKLKPNEGKRDKGYTCTVCNIEILNSPNIIRLHNEGQRHKQNVLKCERLGHDGPWIEWLKYSNNNYSHDFEEEWLQIPFTIELPKREPKMLTVTTNNATINVPNAISNIDKLKKVSNDINEEKFQHETNMRLFCSEQTKSTNFYKDPTKTVPDKAITTKPVPIATDDNGLFCTVCTDIVPNSTRNINEHLKGVTHKTNEAKQISSPMKPLCPDQTKSTETAAVKAVTSKSVITTDVNGAFCTVCKVEVPNNAGNITEHLKGLTHKTNEAQQILSQTKPLCPDQTKSTETAAVKAVTSKSVITTDVNGAFCTVCKVEVPNNAGNITEHLKGLTHKTNEAQQISSQTKPLCPDQTKSTETAAVKAVTSKSVITTDVNGAFCTVCKVEVPNNAGNITEHLKGLTHKTNEAQQISSQTKPLCPDQTKSTETAAVKAVTSKTTDVNGVFCTVCKVEVPNNAENITEHLKGLTHKTNEAKQISSQTKPLCLYQIKSTETAAVKAVTSKSVITTDVNGDFSTVRKVNAPKTAGNINEIFIKGLTHKTNEAKQISSQTKPLCLYQIKSTETAAVKAVTSKSVITTDVNGDFSTVRKVNAPKTAGNINEILIKGLTHKRNEAQQISSQTKPLQKSLCSDQTKTSETAAVKAVTSKSVTITTDVNGAFCTVCKVKVPNNVRNIDEHLKGEAHRKENEKVKGKPVIISTYSHQVFCTVCKALIPNSIRNIQDHLNGTRHSQNLALNSAAAQSNHSVERYSTSSNTSNNHAVVKNAEININKVRQTTKNVQMITSASTSTDTTSNSRESSNNRYTGTFAQTIFSNNTCLVCNVAVFNHPGNIKDHIKGARHKNNIAMLEENLTADKKALPAKSEEKTNECKNVNIIKQSEISNATNPLLACITKLSENKTSKNQNKTNCPVSTDTLRINTSTSIGNEATSSFTNNFANTDTNSDGVVTNDGVITNHDLNTNNIINSSNDGANTNNDAVASNINENKQAENTSETTSDSEGFFICNICEMLINNNQTDIQCHLNGFHHKNKVIEKQDKVKKAKINLDNLTHFCDICNVDIAKKSMGAVKEHNESLQHLRNFEKLLKANKIQIRNDKVCHCEICDLYFSKFSLSSHIIRETHKNLMKAAEAATDSPS